VNKPRPSFRRTLRVARTFDRGGTAAALEQGANTLGTSLRGSYPVADLPRRLVAHMLRMATFKFRYPVTLLIVPECNNTPQQSLDPRE
jgi:hypothetical protein